MPDATRSAVDPAATNTDDPAAHTPAVAPTAAGRYVLGDEIAHGGMGTVYRATDAAFGREVAIKVLQERFAPDSGTARRFADEARITGQLQHPGIPPAHDLGTLPDGRPFLAMKLIKGRTLDQLLAARPDAAADRGRFLAIYEQVCQAIAYAHSRGVIHRDLKPANVMVGAFGEVQVMDWGLAKVLGARPGDTDDPEETRAGTLVVSLRDSDGSFTQAGSVLGTPAYMPPEQAIGVVGKVDRRSDVFGLGAILAVILTGQPPFAGESVETSRLKATQGQLGECFARLDASGAEPDLVALCQCCLAPLPADRPAAADEVAQAVAGLRVAADERARRAEVDRVRLEGERATAEARAAERRRRRRLLLGAAALVVVLAVGGLAAVLVVQRRANDELADKNAELAAAAQRERDKFELATDAIRAYHTGASEDVLLREPGFEKLRAKLLADAGAFYRKLEARVGENPDRATRLALARGYAALGKLNEQAGSTTGALADYGRAEQLLAGLAAAAPTDAEALRELAEVRMSVADVHGVRGDKPTQYASSAQAVEAAEAAAAAAPEDLNAALTLARALGQRALFASEAERQRLEYRAVPLAERVVAARPGDPKATSELAELLVLVELRLDKQGTTEDLLRIDDRRIALLETAVQARPDDPEYRHALTKAIRVKGVTQQFLKRPAEALPLYQRAVDAEKALVEEYPAVFPYHHSLAGYQRDVATALNMIGRQEDALAAARASAATLVQFVARHPDRPNLARTFAGSTTDVANTLRSFGRSDEALAVYDRAVTVLNRLAADRPIPPDVRFALGNTLNERAFLLLTTGRPKDAVPDAEKARDLYAELARSDMNDRLVGRNLVTAWGVLGQALRLSGRTAEAVAAGDRSVELAEVLAGEPAATNDDQRALRWALGEAQVAVSEAGDLSRAWAFRERMLAVAEKLVATDPKSERSRSDLALALNAVAVARHTQGRPAEARHLSDQAIAELERLAADYPRTVDYRERLAIILGNVANLAEQDGDRAEALKVNERAVGLLERVIVEAPNDAYCQRALALRLTAMAKLHRRLGQTSEAAALIERAAALTAKLASKHPDALPYINPRVVALEGLAAQRAAEGRPAEAGALVRMALDAIRSVTKPDLDLLGARAWAEATYAGLAPRDPALVAGVAGPVVAIAIGEWYARQAVATLREMAAQGYANHRALETGEAYDAIRDRPDFKALVAELKAKAAAARRPREVVPPPGK
jgi:tetratricopeptide (TPR) repeat protein